MKPGSKAWAKLIRKYFFIARGLAALSILLLLFQQLADTHLYASFFGVMGFLSLGIFYVLAAFSPIHEQPAWEIVFPELRKKKSLHKN